MVRFSLLALAAFPLALLACPTPHPVVPSPDGDATVADRAAPPLDIDASTTCQAACARLSSLGCPEGQLSDCPTVIEEVQDRMTNRTDNGLPLTCSGVAAAATVQAARAAGVECAGVSR